MERLEYRQLLTITVDNPVDELDLDSTPGDISLREAIRDSNPAGDTINFAPSLNGATIDLTLASQIEFDKSLTIDASSLSNGITIDRGIHAPGGLGTWFRIFDITDPTSGSAPPLVTLKNLTLTGANGNGNGGAIRSAGQLVLDGCTIDDNYGNGSGVVYVNVANDNGARTNSLEVLKIVDSFIQNNYAHGSGGVAVVSGDASHHTEDTVTITNTTFTNNGTFGIGTSNQGGGLYAQLFGASLTMENSTFDGNAAGTGGGVFVVAQGADADNISSINVTNTHFLDNYASGGGGMSAILGDYSTLIVDRALFNSNEAAGGGGLSLLASGASASTTIIRSEFVNANTAAQVISTFFLAA
jgi:hypothetical protein